MSRAGVWTEESVARLTGLVGAGFSSGQIAKVLSDEFGRISRNAVIGKIERMPGLQLKGAPPKRRTEAKPGAPARKTMLSRQAAGPRLPGRLKALALTGGDAIGISPEIEALAELAPAVQAHASPAEDPAAYDAASRHLALVDLERGDCRYPVTDDPGGRHLFCGLPADGSYCAHHRLRCGGGAREVGAPARPPASLWGGWRAA